MYRDCACEYLQVYHICTYIHFDVCGYRKRESVCVRMRVRECIRVCVGIYEGTGGRAGKRGKKERRGAD